MNKLLREWLHQAALAAAAFSGQPHGTDLAEPRLDAEPKNLYKPSP